MAAQRRLLRREFVGNVSLRTTDHCIKASLLPDFSPSTTTVEGDCKVENGLFLCQLDNVLSPVECDRIIKNAKNQFGFENMSDKYRHGKQRNGSRLLAIDEVLAKNLWDNIKLVLSDQMEKLQIPKQPLGFGVAEGEWELDGLNQALRVNKYCSENKEFFAPHKDAQFCPNADQRSLLTLLVYLNDDFEGGNTCFYFPKDVTKNTKGMTIKEETVALGGLKDGFDCMKVVPRVGKAVLFSQNLLHESLPVLTGEKNILKTDVIVKRHTQLGLNLKDEEKSDFWTCLQHFRNAQRHELSKEYDVASDLYERALSIRYCSRPLSTAAIGNKMPKRRIPGHLPDIVWRHIIDFLPCCDVRSLCEVFPQVKELVDDREKFSDFKYIPRVCDQSGAITKFEFADAAFVSMNLDSCCRVVALYSLFLLSHRAEDEVYIVHFNPKTQGVIAVNLVSFLSDAFFGRKCHGSFYTVHQQGPEKDPQKDFAASVDRTYMLLKHGVEFVGIEVSDNFQAKRKDDCNDLRSTCKHDGSDVLYTFDEEQVIPIEHVLRYYEQMKFEDDFVEDDDMIDRIDEKAENFSKNTDVIFHEVVNEIVDNGVPSVALLFKSEDGISIESDEACICPLGPNDELMERLHKICTVEFYNHLVFDFERIQLSVTCEDKEFLEFAHFEKIAEELEELGCTESPMLFRVNIEPIATPGSSFNHASCQCVHPSFATGEFCSLKSYPHLTEIIIAVKEVKGKMFMWSVYCGVVAL